MGVGTDNGNFHKISGRAHLAILFTLLYMLSSCDCDY